MQIQRYNKFWVALGAALAVTAAALSDGQVTGSELVQIIVALIGAAGVFMTENKQPTN